MILRLGSCWQTVTADLALILFMVTAQAIREPAATPAPSSTPAAARAAAPDPLPDPADPDLAGGTGLAIYRPGSGVALGDWLEATITDDRQAPTVYVRYRPGAREAALKQGSQLVGEIERAGRSARLVVEPAAVAGAMVVIGYTGDGDTDGMIVAGKG